MPDDIAHTNTDQKVDDNLRPNAVTTPPPSHPPMGATAATAAAPALDPRSGRGAASAMEDRTSLFASNEATELRGKWDSIQVAFVDQPRQAVEQADALVQEAMNRLSTIFGNERQALEQQWERKENVSTEDLRLALQRYRSFFSRLLSM